MLHCPVMSTIRLRSHQMLGSPSYEIRRERCWLQHWAYQFQEIRDVRDRGIEISGFYYKSNWHLSTLVWTLIDILLWSGIHQERATRSWDITGRDQANKKSIQNTTWLIKQIYQSYTLESTYPFFGQKCWNLPQNDTNSKDNCNIINFPDRWSWVIEGDHLGSKWYYLSRIQHQAVDSTIGLIA